MNRGGLNHQFDNRGDNHFGGSNRPEFNNHENRPMNQERGGNEGYNRPADNHSQFNQGREQGRGGFGGGEQHFASNNNPQGGFGHRMGR